MHRFLFFAILLSPLIHLAQERTQPEKQAQELGKIAWYRDYDQALALAKKNGKPVFLLFQEVPGCSTCRNYGKGVLSNQLLVSIIENEFIPLAVFNNKAGKDKEVLKRYDEPSWNNPVVRIIDAEGKNLIQRIAGNYSKEKVAMEIIQLLEKNQKAIPNELRYLAKGLAY